MKHLKRMISLVLTIALLCAMPAILRIQGEASNTVVYPSITIGGGWHPLYFDEGTPEEHPALDAVGFGEALKMDEILAALQALDFNLLVDKMRDGMWEMFGPIRMLENGESEADNITAYGITYTDDNVFGDDIWCYLDWRLDPVDNAEHLRDFIEYCKTKRGADEKFCLKGMSGSGAVLLAYLDKYGYDDLDGVIFETSLHNGSSFYSELAKHKVTIDPKAVGMTYFLGGLKMDVSVAQPYLRILYESGLLDVLIKLLSQVSGSILDRIYDEILIPLIFMMPVFWSYVTVEDYEEAKAALLKGDPKYDDLVAKIDRYHYGIMPRTDDIILDVADHLKVGVTAGYGMAMIPLGKGMAVQSDTMLDTVYASLGATCAPLNTPFWPWYKQQKDDGHNHISPDRLIDASTCLLPEQTWFFFNSPHGPHEGYSGWYEWFKRTENPTVFDSEDYPQFMEEIEPNVFVPLVAEPRSLFVDLLKTAGLYLLKIWRWLLLSSLEWLLNLNLS